MSEPGIILKKSKVTQTIDLNEVVGKDISKDSRLVRRIGQAIIDYMEERVEDGKGIGGVKLKSPYSDSYADSLDFKAAGKSKNEVNMKLTGDMMSSIDILEEDGAKLTIGIEDSSQAIKAYGHQTGFEGHPVLKGPQRRFFGISTEELKKKILPEFESDIEQASRTTTEESDSLISFVKNIRSVADLFDET